MCLVLNEKADSGVLMQRENCWVLFCVSRLYYVYSQHFLGKWFRKKNGLYFVFLLLFFHYKGYSDITERFKAVNLVPCVCDLIVMVICCCWCPKCLCVIISLGCGVIEVTSHLIWLVLYTGIKCSLDFKTVMCANNLPIIKLHGGFFCFLSCVHS